MSAQSAFFKDEPDAWNLAYLSWDFESSEQWPDAHFSTDVRRTLQFGTTTGEPDLINWVQADDTVRWLIRNPAPRVVKLLLAMPRFKELPLYLAYGDFWTETIQARSFLYRESDDQSFDFNVNDLSQARMVLKPLLLK